MFSLKISLLSLRNNQITLTESVCHTFKAFKRLRTHTTEKRSRNTLLIRSHDFNSLSKIDNQAVIINSRDERLLNVIDRHDEEV